MASDSGTLAAVDRFNDAFNRHNVGDIMSAKTDDCLFENTNPAPDGARLVGQDAVRAYWTLFLRRTRMLFSMRKS